MREREIDCRVSYAVSSSGSTSPMRFLEFRLNEEDAVVAEGDGMAVDDGVMRLVCPCVDTFEAGGVGLACPLLLRDFEDCSAWW